MVDTPPDLRHNNRNTDISDWALVRICLVIAQEGEDCPGGGLGPVWGSQYGILHSPLSCTKTDIIECDLLSIAYNIPFSVVEQFEHLKLSLIIEQII